MKKQSLLNSIISLLIILIFKNLGFAQNIFPSDKAATKQTIHLYQNLKKLATNGFMFGHQDDLAYGLHWQYKDDSSDVKIITGDYPALFGWDLAGLESNENKNIDGIPFELEKKFTQWVYEHGGVNTYSWHCLSPLGDGKTAWDTTHGTIKSILPGGVNHRLYNQWLDKAADFLESLRGPNGELIPILFRPFHEFTGNWFWWCQNTCTASDFIKLWRYEIHYLRDIKHLHNLLIVYNPSDNFSSAQDFMARYPGDDVVDILSFDSYQKNINPTSDSFENNLNNCLSIIEKIARQKDKLFAIAEAGYNRIPDASWWTEKLMKGIGKYRISYLLVWRNAYAYPNVKEKDIQYYIPPKGDVSAKDFMKFYDLKNTLFLKDVAKEKLYK